MTSVVSARAAEAWAGCMRAAVYSKNGICSDLHMRTAALFVAIGQLMGCQPEPVWTADSLPSPRSPLPPCIPGPHGPGLCAERCGTYATSVEQIEGDCGTRPEQLSQVSGNPTMAAPPCRGIFGVSSDNCSTQFDIRCPSKDSSGTTLASIERGSLTWSHDADSAQGSVELWVTSAHGAVLCRSRYLVSVQRR
jgi:hypothetical protein